MIVEYIKDSEALGLKGICRKEELEAMFEDWEIKDAMMNGEIWSPRPGFYKVCDITIKEAPEYRWDAVKSMLDDIPPENTHYSRVQALIRCGDELLQDHSRLTRIIYRWHERHISMLNKLKSWANKHGMKKDSKMSGYYHFATLYPIHVKEFWGILGVGDKK